MNQYFFGPQAKLPNNSIIQAHKKGYLPLPTLLSPTARLGHVFNGLTNSSLLSIGQLFDDDCVAVFDKKHLKVLKNQQLVLQGNRNLTDGLWDVPMPVQYPTFQPTINVIIKRNQTKIQLAEYLHKFSFSPAISTFLKAIKKGHFITWPGINKINFSTSLKNLIPTAKGHLDQERSNLQSTKYPSNIDDDFFPEKKKQQKKL